MKNYPTQKELLEIFYDNGKDLIWIQPSQGRTLGAVAGSVNGEYMRVSIKDTAYQVHIVMWIMRHGPMPEGYEIDHRDRNGLNNVDSNMRLATRSQNGQNRAMCKCAGVYFRADRKRWYARIKVDSTSIHLGSFHNEKDALNARASAELKYFGEFIAQDF